MPELPEVETVARQLAPLLAGRRVLEVEIYDPLLKLPGAGALVGRRIGAVRRIGKQVGIELAAEGAEAGGAAGAIWLLVHLRMTGRLGVAAPGTEPPVPPMRARLRLDRGALVFSDVRRFGTLRLAGSAAEAAPAGLDPLSPRLTAVRLGALLAGGRGPIKPWLLRQDRLVGLGNIYASEALFAARLDPSRPAGSLGAAEVGRLHRALRRVLRAAIAHGGTTFSSFEDARGERGGHLPHLRVYGRAGQRCPRCREATIERMTQQQRSTYHCPRCQK